MNNSPLITTAAITSIVGALIALLIAFGVRLTPEQQAAISGFVLVVAPWVVALVGHNTTTPLSKPQDEDGTPLVRANSDNAPTLKQTRNALKM
jgi:hypothetical protein